MIASRRCTAVGSSPACSSAAAVSESAQCGLSKLTSCFPLDCDIGAAARDARALLQPAGGHQTDFVANRATAFSSLYLRVCGLLLCPRRPSKKVGRVGSAGPICGNNPLSFLPARSIGAHSSIDLDRMRRDHHHAALVVAVLICASSVDAITPVVVTPSFLPAPQEVGARERSASYPENISRRCLANSVTRSL